MKETDRIRVLIVGCGDVFIRHYLPAIEALRAHVEIRAVVDPRPGAADTAARTVADWSPAVVSELDLATALARGNLDAALNLTPTMTAG